MELATRNNGTGVQLKIRSTNNRKYDFRKVTHVNHLGATMTRKSVHKEEILNWLTKRSKEILIFVKES